MTHWSADHPEPPEQEHYRLWMILLIIFLVLAAVVWFLRWSPFGGSGSEQKSGKAPLTSTKALPSGIDTLQAAHASQAEEPTAHVETNGTKPAAEVPWKEFEKALTGISVVQQTQTAALLKMHESLQEMKAAKTTTTTPQTNPAPKETAAQRRQRAKEAQREEEERQQKLQELATEDLGAQERSGEAQGGRRHHGRAQPLSAQCQLGDSDCVRGANDQLSTRCHEVFCDHGRQG